MEININLDYELNLLSEVPAKYHICPHPGPWDGVMKEILKFRGRLDRAQFQDPKDFDGYLV